MVSEHHVVAVVTYRRPHGLGETLDSLLKQTFAPASIIVIDNDPEGSARSVVKNYASVRYVLEPEPGIAAARNAAVAVAMSIKAVTLSFIDDDEQASVNWLGALVSMLRETGADAVTGPVDPVYAYDADPHIVSDGFFARAQHADGARVKRCSTGNVCIRLSSLAAAGLHPFRHDFGISGGSDSELFERLGRLGQHFVWSQDALVFETVPIERANPAWITRRLRRFGNTDGRIALLHTTRTVVFLCAVGRVSIGLAPHLLLGLGRRTGSWRRSVTFLRGMGMLQAAVGDVIREYSR